MMGISINENRRETICREGHEKREDNGGCGAHLERRERMQCLHRAESEDEIYRHRTG